MSINEDCLLRFLLNPDEIFINTEILTANNKIFEKEFIIKNISNKIKKRAFKNKEVLF